MQKKKKPTAKQKIAKKKTRQDPFQKKLAKKLKTSLNM